MSSSSTYLHLFHILYLCTCVYNIVLLLNFLFIHTYALCTMRVLYYMLDGRRRRLRYKDWLVLYVLCRGFGEDMSFKSHIKKYQIKKAQVNNNPVFYNIISFAISLTLYYYYYYHYTSIHFYRHIHTSSHPSIWI